MTEFSPPPCDPGVVRAAPCASPCAPGAAPWILAATILGSSMAFIDGTVVNVALPALQRELNASLVDVQWVEESFVGAASGINNAASRVAALLSVALFGLIMASIFNRDLHGNVERAALSPAVIDAVEQQRHEILG